MVIIGRIYLPNQPQDGDPNQRAQDWWNNPSVGSVISQYPAVDYWEVS